MLWSVCTLVCTLTVVSAGAGETGEHSPVVSTQYGALRGIRTTVGNHSYVDVFHHVPYARPPVGDLRFEKPLPPGNWSGVRDASKPGAQCPQRHINMSMARVFVSDEDCLHLNVYTPKTTPGEGPLPVMVWIHGGSYYAGTGNSFDGRQLASKGVVVVTINYRLDALGFFSMENGDIPGNYGLWDMIRALEWVRDVISAFNGDPDNVTIFGVSSGSSSVSLLILSQAAQGLFHKAIMESGVSLSPWATAHRGIMPEARVYGRMLAKRLHCDQSDYHGMLDCFRQKPAMEIINDATEIQEIMKDLLYLPVIESTFGHAGVFSSTPLSTLEGGLFNNATAIRGFNADESVDVSDPENDGLTLDDFKSQLHDMVQWDINRYSSLSTDAIEIALLDAYVIYPKVTDPVHMREAFLQMKSDYSIVAPTIHELTLTTEGNPNPQYLYRFSYRSPNRLSPKRQGTQHTDEVPYVFGTPISDDDIFTDFVSGWTDEDKRVSNDIMTMWTDFAKHGNPNPGNRNDVTWLPWTPSSPNYLEIGATDRALSGFRAQQMAVWTNTILRPERDQDNIIG